MTAFQRLSALLALSLATFAATAQPAATPATGAATRVLFVGNSMTYANNMPRILRALAASQPGGPAIDTATYVIPGAELDELWDDGHAAAALREGDWDVVVLQERGGLVLCNARTTRTPECRRSDAAHRAFADLAKERGARTLLLMTWPPARGTDLKDAHGLDKLGERLQNSYATLERRLARGGAPVTVVPAATTLYAFARGREPESILADGVHPSVEASLVMAAQLYASIIGQPAQAADMVIDFPLLPENALIHPDSPMETQAQIAGDGSKVLLKAAALVPLYAAAATE